jgi:hypothetical protein
MKSFSRKFDGTICSTWTFHDSQKQRPSEVTETSNFNLCSDFQMYHQICDNYYEQYSNSFKVMNGMVWAGIQTR